MNISSLKTLKEDLGRMREALPFNLASPSYIWPDGYAGNVRKLKEVFGEVQLLAFETLDQSPISRDEIDELKELKADGLEYCVHLPAPSNLARMAGDGVYTALKAMEVFRPLGVTGYVLHVEKPDDGFYPSLAAERVAEILERSSIPPEMICVENLAFPFEEIWGHLEPLGVSICYDVGHMIHAGGDPFDFIGRYAPRIRMAHIHGVDGRDHLPLTAFSSEFLMKIVGAFSEMKLPGALVIENFSEEDITASVRHLFLSLEKHLSASESGDGARR